MRVLLIDGLNFIYKGNISFKPSGNQIENVESNKPNYTLVFNFMRNLRSLIEQFEPDRVFFILEGNSNFRYALYPQYKANRIIKKAHKSEKEKEDFNLQVNEIIRLVSYLPITLVKSDEYEADDTIATLVENLKDEDLTIVSGDSDFIQLLQKKYSSLRIYHPIRKQFIEAPAYHYLVWKCLRGDKKSDNIDGIVGEKTALKLIENPSLLRDFLSNAENLANFNLNKRLIELNPFDYNLLKFTEYNVDFDYLKNEFERMEMPTLISDKYWERFVWTFKSLL